MANLSKIRREKMLEYLEKLKTIKNDDEHISAITEIENALNEKKYGLVWEEHSEKVDEMLEHNIPIFVEDEERKIAVNKDEAYNFLLEGDNIHSLKLLEKTHKGKIDVIYIDPPYNTGARDWKYDNCFVDGTDSFRHSKWLSFMYERLIVAKEILANKGVICVTIDDYELPNIWLLMDSIFGEVNRLGVVTIRNNPKGRMNKAKISQVHEYALFYGKTLDAGIVKIPIKPEDKSHNYVQDENGNYYVKVNLRKQGVDSEAERADGTLKERYFPVYFDPITREISTEKKLDVEILPIDNNGNKRIWRRDKNGIKNLFDSGDLMVSKIGGAYQIHFRFRGGLDGELPKSIWYDSQFSASEYGTRILSELIGREKFPYPKSLPAVQYALKCMSNSKNITVLDFFAGSGTTGHAVMQLNKEDGGNRKYILCTNNENNICEEVTYQRLKKIQEELPHNLKYFKTDFIPKFTDNEDSVSDKIMDHIQELIELEHALEIDGRKYIIISDEDKLDKIISDIEDGGKLFVRSGIFLTRNHQRLLEEKDVSIIEIPEYYFREELKEIGEL